MTDKELLEAAAKAAGLSVAFNDHGNPGIWGEWRGLPQWEDWNPLTDDGDALRLAVKLREKFRTNIAACFGIGRFDEWSADPYAATRRAIVRAAAAMAVG